MFSNLVTTSIITCIVQDDDLDEDALLGDDDSQENPVLEGRLGGSSDGEDSLGGDAQVCN